MHDAYQYLYFGFYDWEWCKENTSLDISRLRKFFGVANSVSNIMIFHVLLEPGMSIVDGTMQRVS